jgi:hypothetical protein
MGPGWLLPGGALRDPLWYGGRGPGEPLAAGWYWWPQFSWSLKSTGTRELILTPRQPSWFRHLRRITQLCTARCRSCAFSDANQMYMCCGMCVVTEGCSAQTPRDPWPARLWTRSQATPLDSGSAYPSARLLVQPSLSPSQITHSLDSLLSRGASITYVANTFLPTSSQFETLRGSAFNTLCAPCPS